MRPSPRGIALPLTLLFLVALTALAWAAFGLARAAQAGLRWEVPWFVTGFVPLEGGAYAETRQTHLGGGYHLERMTHPLVPGGPVAQRVIWCLIPALEAERGSETHGGRGAPVLGPLTLEHVASTLSRGRIPALHPPPSFRLLSVNPEDFLLEVESVPGVRLAVARGTVVLDGAGVWRGLLLIEGEVLPQGTARLQGGLWRWGTASGGFPRERLQEDPDARTRALEALPSCPHSLFHLTDLGRRS
jgi:hypothetical protein